MPNYYTPGVYIEEVNTGPRPIEAVATAVAAFAGFAPAGPIGASTLVTSWTQFVETFGRRDPATGRKDPFIKDAYLAHAVYGFFLNGGTRCYVVRVLPEVDLRELRAEPLQISTAAARARKHEQPMLKISPKPPKKAPQLPQPLPSADIQVSLERAAGSTPKDLLWTIRVAMGEAREEYRNVTLASPADPADQGAAQQPAAGDQQPEAPKKVRKPAPQAAEAASHEVTAPASAEQPQAEAAPPEPSPQPAPGPSAEEPGAQPANGRPGLRPKVTTLEEINTRSELISIDVVDAGLVGEAPALGVYYIDVPQPAIDLLSEVKPPDIIGDPIEHTGMSGLELEDDVTMVCCPDLVSPLAYPGGEVDWTTVHQVQLAMINHCELVGGRMAILDTPPELRPQQVARWRLDETGYDSMFAALYYPWINVANPRVGKDGEPSTIAVPPCGHIAGIYARSDTERGVHKAPANEVVRGALGPVLEVSHGEQAGLNPDGVNCIRSFRGRGVRVWGARTLTSDPAWRYVNVRRLFNMVEKSIERDTQWVVFEPNDPGLWSRVRRDVTAFLMTLWRDGALFGNTPQEAFFVKCDEELNPRESRDLGRLIIEVGMAPVKPAEFVIFRFSQYTAGSQ